jgi:hypothetical protein
LNPIELIWATIKIWAADRNVTFRSEDVTKPASGKFALINRDGWKVRCSQLIASETQYVATEALLDEDQKIVVLVWNQVDG